MAGFIPIHFGHVGTNIHASPGQIICEKRGVARWQTLFGFFVGEGARLNWAKLNAFVENRVTVSAIGAILGTNAHKSFLAGINIVIICWAVWDALSLVTVSSIVTYLNTHF